MKFPKLPWWLTLEWRMPKIIYALCIIEFPLTVAGLALYGIADPDTYRTTLWKEGAIQGWNSDPIEILYAYANYQPISVPTPWNQFITNYNVIIIVLSMFMLLAKVTAYICHVLPPIISAILHAALASLYAYSISQQAASDYSDPEHPSPVPWYLTRGCGPPVDPGVQSFCMQAKASFAVACCLCILFTTYMAVSIWYAVPSRCQRRKHSSANDIEQPSRSSTWSSSKSMEKQHEVEMSSFNSPRSPMTPRTVAFHTLNGNRPSMGPMTPTAQRRAAGTSSGGMATGPGPGGRKLNKDLPLRHHIAMGNETFKGKAPAH